MKDHPEKGLAAVIRSGRPHHIPFTDLLVGDIAYLRKGDVASADGILVKGHGLICNESLVPGRAELYHKTSGSEVFSILRSGIIHESERLDPFVVSGSHVASGHGVYLVTAVGVNSTHNQRKAAFRSDKGILAIHRKLSIAAKWMSVLGFVSCAVLAIALVGKFAYRLINAENPHDPERWAELSGIGFMFIALLFLVIPDGFLMVSISAYVFAAVKLLRHGVLVRTLSVCELMGRTTVICSNKTSLLTTNSATLAAVASGLPRESGSQLTPPDMVDNRAITGDENLAEFVQNLTEHHKKLIIESITLTSTAVETTRYGQRKYLGSPVDSALLQFCHHWLGAHPLEETKSSYQVIQFWPFNCERGFSAACVKPEEGVYRLFFLGTSHVLLRSCNKVLRMPQDADPSLITLDTVGTEFPSTMLTMHGVRGFSTVVSAYRDFTCWPPVDAPVSDETMYANIDVLRQQLTLISLYWIKEPIQNESLDSIKTCEIAGMEVKLITDDEMKSAKLLATESGIYIPDRGDVAMLGSEFSGLSAVERVNMAPRTKLLAEASPLDKELLVRALKDVGETVAVIGDSTNDVSSLRAADLGAVNGTTGTDVAQEASSVVLLHDG